MNQIAINGGEPAFPAGPPGWPLADDDIRAALDAAWRDGSWGRYEGPHGERLAAQLAELHGTPHVLPCSSGTIAVELALRGLGVAAGDEVILAAYDFPGNFRSIEAVGARPVLVDINPRTWCMDVEQLESALGPQTRAILVSHLHGGLADMPAICEIASRRGVGVVEDACQSPGAVVAGRIAGSWGDVGVLSFGGSKLLTAGRGGAILTQRPDIFQRVKIFCERGNHAFPLSELQAAVLVPQIPKLSERNARRLENVRRLLAALHGVAGLTVVELPTMWRAGGVSPLISREPSGASQPPLAKRYDDDRPSFYKLAFLYDAAACSRRSRDEFIAAIQAEGIALDAGFRGFVDRSENRCRKPHPLPHARLASDATLLLHHPVLLETGEAIDLVGGAIQKVVAEYSQNS